MIYFIILIAITVTVIILIKNQTKQQPNFIYSESVTKRKNKPIGTYKNQKLMIDLSGVHYRVEAFHEVKEGDHLTIRFEPENKHDKNAIGAYTNTGKLVGYIPRNQRKIIKTLSINTNITALIINKYNNEGYYKLTVELWVGELKQ